MFRRPEIGREELIVGVVGVLQFDVLEHRLRSEYGVELRREPLDYRFVRWIDESPCPAENLRLSSTSIVAKDRFEREVILFQNEWSIRWAEENNKGLRLADTAKATF